MLYTRIRVQLDILRLHVTSPEHTYASLLDKFSCLDDEGIRNVLIGRSMEEPTIEIGSNENMIGVFFACSLTVNF